jgi:hypothetical protein
MKFKSLLAKPFAAIIAAKVKKEMLRAVDDQQSIWQELIKVGRKTEFGNAHQFDQIQTIADFQQAVPIRDYEGLRPYIDKIKEGKHNVLWKGRPIYFAKTSGTTSGVKYIPITKDSIDFHFNSSRNSVLCNIVEFGDATAFDGKLIFLSGSPELERIGDIPTGRLSGIANHQIPRYLRTNQLPTYETNCIEDWETKLDRIVDETINQDMRLISGIPPWMQMYFDRLIERSSKSVGELFPNFNLLVHGGVNFEPYRQRLMDSIGRPVRTIETYPASEGFFAFQDSQQHEGLLLNTNAGIFYEFVKASDIFNDQAKRLTLAEVETGVNYAIIVSTNAGLWAYNIGDTVKFVSKDPYRIVVTGRIKHYISAFGEHVIGEEVEHSLLSIARKNQIGITEFTVAPRIHPEPGQEKPYHEWFVEFENVPDQLEAFAADVDQALRQKNIYYDDLINGNILQRLKIRPVRKGGFIDYMKSIGKLGGQNKVPRLSNDRTIADQLNSYLESK